MSHVMNVRWNNDDKYLFSAGGLDCCTFQWLHKASDGNPAVSDSSDMEAPPTNFGAEPAAELYDVYNPDDGYGMMESGGGGGGGLEDSSSSSSSSSSAMMTSEALNGNEEEEEEEEAVTSEEVMGENNENGEEVNDAGLDNVDAGDVDPVAGE